MSRVADTPEDTERLLHVVAAISAAREDMTPQGRAVKGSSAQPDEALLNEINETVLRRRLVFCKASGQALSLDVAERRIQEILAAPPDLNPDQQTLVNTKLTEQDAQSVADIITRFCASKDPLFVQAHLPEGPDSAVSGGVSVRALRRARDTAQLHARLPPALVAGFDASKSRAIAVVVKDATGVMTWGEGTYEKELCDLALSPVTPDAARCVTLWQGDGLGGKTVVSGTCEGRTIVALCTTDHAMDLFLTWQNLLVGVPEV